MKLPFVALLIFGLAALCPAAGADKKADKKKDPSEIGNRKISGGPNFYSIEKEMALGRQLALEVTRQAKLLEDPIVNEYVHRIGQNLVRHSDVTFPVTLKIIESEQPNAFTLPGGYGFLDTGLIRLTESEAELASTIAHELGHVAARHATRQATQSTIANIATIPMVVLGGAPGMLARNAAGVGVPLAFLKFSRVFESEADMLGLQFLYDTGYDPTASIDIFERLEATERKTPGAVERLFNTHPMSADRIRKTQQNIDALLPPKAEYVVNTSDYEDVRKRLITILDLRKVNPGNENKPTLLKPSER